MFILCNLYLKWSYISCNFLPTSSDLTNVISWCAAVLFRRSITLISRIQFKYMDLSARYHNPCDWNKNFHGSENFTPL
jgi:hypothetical protein